ncbi:hypothetical protein BDFB_014819 [Asbolus verrucosus]|uniref:Uncharacterized protein n=1 Tax=Asbolus verrucosus TaxID=1661398 RepID=A0A482VH34_ASBVE|nr:hypothetical protein BDFB_014819 [Asbolus verrucosus]
MEVFHTRLHKRFSKCIP